MILGFVAAAVVIGILWGFASYDDTRVRLFLASEDFYSLHYIVSGYAKIGGRFEA